VQRPVFRVKRRVREAHGSVAWPKPTSTLEREYYFSNFRKLYSPQEDKKYLLFSPLEETAISLFSLPAVVNRQKV
jgi:hypothetical protein